MECVKKGIIMTCSVRIFSETVERKFNSAVCIVPLYTEGWVTSINEVIREVLVC